MREKNGLDRQAANIINQINDTYETKEVRTRKQKVKNFNDNAVKCEHFFMKSGEMKTKYYWCRKTNKSCLYTNCPLENKDKKKKRVKK